MAEKAIDAFLDYVLTDIPYKRKEKIYPKLLYLHDFEFILPEAARPHQEDLYHVRNKSEIGKNGYRPESGLISACSLEKVKEFADYMPTLENQFFKVDLSKASFWLYVPYVWKWLRGNFSVKDPFYLEMIRHIENPKSAYFNRIENEQETIFFFKEDLLIPVAI